MEEWRAVPGFEEWYEVSSLGHVRAVARTYKGQKTERPARLMSQEIANRHKRECEPYAYVHLSEASGRRRPHSVHSLVLIAFSGPRPDGNVGRHLNGDSLDNRVENLAWGTVAENNADTLRHGRHWWANVESCARGHELADWNLIQANLRMGWRACLACSRARARAKRHQGADMQALSDEVFAEIKEKNCLNLTT